jgi:TonB family protein
MKKFIALVSVVACALPAHAEAVSATSIQDVRIAQQTIPNAVIPPRINSHPAADYTFRAYGAKVEGNVIVQAHVDADGNFTVLKVIKGLGYGLDENALAALQHWRFSPAMRDGERVSVIAEIEIPFKLSTVNERELLHRVSERNRQIRCTNHPDLWARQCRK